MSDMTPGRAIPLADLSDREKLNLIGGAAQAYDYENRPRDRNWTAVPLDQVARLVIGALGAMEFDPPAPEQPQPAPELAAAMAETRKMRDVVCKLLDLYGAPDDRLMQHSGVTRATLQRYAAEAGVHLDRLPEVSWRAALGILGFLILLAPIIYIA